MGKPIAVFALGLGLGLVGLLTDARPARAQDDGQTAPIQTTAEQAILMDGATETVLFAKNADEAFAPASLAKLMTAEIVFSAIADGSIDLQTEYTVSEQAWRQGGAPSGASTMFAELGSSIPVADLLRGMIVQSANDAAIVLAEGMEGSQVAFAERMNERAAALGLEDSHFANPTGLEADGQTVTARDLVHLARHIRRTYPDLYAMYAEPAFEWNGIFQRNRNPLLRMDIGADGMGTGRTEESGFSLVGVTDVDGRVTYLAISGLDSSDARADQGARLLTYAQSAFAMRTLVAANATVGRADVFGGTAGSVALTTDNAVDALIPKGDPDSVTAVVRYDGPLIAPVAQGDEIASLDILVRDHRVLSRPLVAASDVPAGSFADRALGAIDELATGWMRAF